MAVFYCPNCKKLEVGQISYTQQDIIYGNARDGWGLGLHYVICKECEYPLSAVVYDSKTTIDDVDNIEYWKSVITNYQNGCFADGRGMLKAIMNIYVKGANRRNREQVISACDKFLSNPWATSFYFDTNNRDEVKMVLDDILRFLDKGYKFIKAETDKDGVCTVTLSTEVL